MVVQVAAQEALAKHQDALTGDEAVAHGIRLARAQVILAYPIEPSADIIEDLAKFIAEGSLKAEYVRCEGEHGMTSAAISASLAGARAFLATCSQGFLYGAENIAWAPGTRVPLVMAVANRSVGVPLNAVCDHSDAMSARDFGWIQIYVETAQEALDVAIQSYRIAENDEVLLPLMICLDGWYVSHTTEMVDVPDQGSVDRFLPSYRPKHIILDPNNPMEQVARVSTQPDDPMAFEWIKTRAQEAAKRVIEETNAEFGERFGRRYGNGLVETIGIEDADVAMITLGSMTGTARIALEELRKQGKKVGLIRIRSFRPFPREDIQRLTSKLKAVAVFDRNISRGLNEGAAYVEVKSALYNMANRPPVIGIVAGLHAAEIFPADFVDVANKLYEIAETGKVEQDVYWIPSFDVKVKQSPAPNTKDKLYYSGSAACPSCGMSLVFRHMLEVLGSNIVITRTAGCQGWGSNALGKTLVNVPMGRSSLPSGGAAATGIVHGLRARGRDDVKVVLFAGDGSFGDMGFCASSGVAERNEDVIVVIYDNETYATTGLQRSASTPQFADTPTTPVGEFSRGNARPKKDLPLIMAAHKVTYVATASVGDIPDFRRKLEKAKDMKGLRYIQVSAPCPPAWEYPWAKTIEVARLGVSTGLWPLYEIEGGKFKLSHKPRKLKAVSDYIGLQKRFGHVTEEEVEGLQRETEARWSEYKRWEKTGLKIF